MTMLLRVLRLYVPLPRRRQTPRSHYHDMATVDIKGNMTGISDGC